MIRTLNGHAPELGPGAFVHEAAEVIVRVRLGARSSVWPKAVIRADAEETTAPRPGRPDRRPRRLVIVAVAGGVSSAPVRVAFRVAAPT